MFLAAILLAGAASASASITCSQVDCPSSKSSHGACLHGGEAGLSCDPTITPGACVARSDHPQWCPGTPTNPIFGVSYASLPAPVGMSTEIATIDRTLGAMAPVGKPVAYELQAQQLSALDATRGEVFVLGFNASSKVANVVGIDVSDGKVADEANIKWLVELPFVGLGQTIDVDPATGDLIVSGAAATNQSLTRVARITRASKFQEHTVVATVPQANDPPIYILGGSSTLDYINGVAYLQGAVNDTKTGEVYIQLVAVDLKTGAHTATPQEVVMSGMDWDEATGRIYGVGVANSGKQNMPHFRQLAFFDTKTQTWGTLANSAMQKNLTMMSGAVQTLDPQARVHYCLLMPSEVAGHSFVPATGCAACTKGAICCRDPAQGAGSCFKTSACSAMHTGGGLNTSLPFHLVQTHLDTGANLGKPALCSMQKQDCPWSLHGPIGIH